MVKKDWRKTYFSVDIFSVFQSQLFIIKCKQLLVISLVG